MKPSTLILRSWHSPWEILLTYLFPLGYDTNSWNATTVSIDRIFLVMRWKLAQVHYNQCYCVYVYSVVSVVSVSMYIIV